MGTSREIGPLRLAAQRLVGPDEPTAADAVRWSTATQAQDYPGALTSVALRTRSGTRAAVEAALDAGQVVRSWPLRGTLHLVAAEDLPWILELTTPRVIAGAASRRAQLGLDPAALDQAERLAVAALTGGRRLGRAGLLAHWDAHGLSTAGGRGYHLLWYLAQTGVLCYGPVRGGEQLLVLVDEWIPRPRRLARDEALGELALRYFRSHGPATVKDFTRWANLLAADVRAGVALARPHLATLEVDGVEHLMDPRTPELLDAAREHADGVILLPGFDEFILGYGDRGAVLPPEFADRIVPGNNGVFRPTVVSAGQVVATWQRTGRGARQALAVAPFRPLPEVVTAAVERVYAALP